MMISTLRRLRHGPLKMFDPFWLLLGKLYRKVVENIPGLKTSQYINKYGPFKLDAKFTFSNFENWGHDHNEGFVNCIEDCRGKQCVFDIGAHIGLVSLPLSQVVSGRIYAFEPAVANKIHLMHHLEYNNISNVEVHSCLVGSETKQNVEFFEQHQATGMNSRVVKKDHHLYHQTTREQIRLDDFCSQYDVVPEVIKIDVEGAEYDVLLGAINLLKKYSPIVYLSVHPKELTLMGHSVDKVTDLLKNMNYYALDSSDLEITTFGFSEYRFTKKDF